ncbi:MAG: alpha/beta fold hydrolase [Candidatus Dormibacteraeota bacterium]|nr:alpha/beta fold hydrolase [Candidatus Dormibacteraeota bacterium]
MRAKNPYQKGYVARRGVNLYYEVFGSGEPTVFFLPTWSIIHSRHWKSQIPYFARHFRVLTFDGRGNGRSDRPDSPAAYADTEYAADALSVMDRTGTDKAVLVSLSAGSRWALLLAAEHPDRVLAAAFVSPSMPIAPGHPERERASQVFGVPQEHYEGWLKFNEHYWREDYRGFLEFFFSRMFTEPHSTKQIEDCVGWGLETTAETLIATIQSPALSPQRVTELASQVRCPVLVVQGDHDAISTPARGDALAEATRGALVVLEGSGHAPHARDPVKVNVLLRDFVESTDSRAPAVSHWPRGRHRAKRALYISSPIGLGHAQRDVAIADELRKLHPDLQIDWLAQHPVTEVLKARGERIHPASVELASESKHIESEAAEHDLHCFQAWRRMDEILIADFMVFHDVVREEQYDLWIGDEAWELDYYLHENPEQKRAAYAWLTDFVGWLPMADGGDREVSLTTDYNAEMIEHIGRFPRVRDRAIFVGDPEDIVPDRFGAGLPLIRDWTEEHYDFSGYITGFDPAAFADRASIRAGLGYRPDEKVCIVTVGGSGVGSHLLRRVIAAFPEAKRRVPELRMIVVAGPRIDPVLFGTVEGLEIRGYVHELYRHLAVCDLAVVQGGLTTTMELTANNRPFLYFPLAHHFEQNFHVRHRLNRHTAGRYMDFRSSTPELIAEAMVEELKRPIHYRSVTSDGAARAARRIAELL